MPCVLDLILMYPQLPVARLFLDGDVHERVLPNALGVEVRREESALPGLGGGGIACWCS